MGREIVYCGDCGKQLHEEDFARGRANVVDSRPFCIQCMPAPAAPPSAPASKDMLAHRRPTPPSHPKVRSSVRIPKVEGVPHGDGSKKRVLLIGGGAGGVVLLLIVILALSSGGKEPVQAPPTDPPPTTAKPAGVERTPPKPAVDPAAEAMRRLESLASGGEPDATLQACDEARRLLKGRPEERRIDEIEGKALAARRERNRERELEKALSEAKRMEEGDPELLKSAEVEGMLGVALKLAGGRTAEVQKRLDEYRARAKVAAERRGKGPFEPDGQGYLLNWLVLGPFPNADEKGYATDFLKGEAAHVAKEGLEVARPDGTKARWGLHASSSGRVRFHEVPQLGVGDKQAQLVCYAACKVQAAADVDVLLRVGSDDGHILWLDGRELGRSHEHRPAMPDQESYPARLAKGMHTLLIKVEQADGDYEFLLRITLPDGALPSGLRLWN